MAPKYVFVSDIDSRDEIPRVLIRVVRKWLVLDADHPGEYFTLELVLMDSKGDRIGCTIRNPLVYMFRDRLVEDEVYLLTKLLVVPNVGEYRGARHPYKLSFDYKTNVAKQSKIDYPLITYQFTPPSDVFSSTFDINYLVDLMGIICGVSKEREYYKKGEKSKLIVIELDNEGYRFKVTLFGDEVDALNTFLASGDTLNGVVVILFAKVKKWSGGLSISNNYSTKMLFNPDIPEVRRFKSAMVVQLDTPIKGLSQLQEKTNSSIADDFLKLTPRATIKQMKDAFLKNKQIISTEESYFVILATITDMVDEDTWYYTACSRCTRKATPDSGMYYCGKCKKHVIDVTPSFLLRLRVKDDSGVATFVMFNRDASELLQKSCAELLLQYNNEGGLLPKELSDLQNQTILFKIGCDRGSASRFEPSYIVKRVSGESEIIQQFTNPDNVQIAHEIAADPITEAFSDNSRGARDVAQDLTEKFEEAENVAKDESRIGDVVDLCADTPAVLGVKRSCPIGDTTSSVPIVMKNIKVEKE